MAKKCCGNCDMGSRISKQSLENKEHLPTDRICMVIGGTFNFGECGCGEDYYKKAKGKS